MSEYQSPSVYIEEIQAGIVTNAVSVSREILSVSPGDSLRRTP